MTNPASQAAREAAKQLADMIGYLNGVTTSHLVDFFARFEQQIRDEVGGGETIVEPPLDPESRAQIRDGLENLGKLLAERATPPAAEPVGEGVRPKCSCMEVYGEDRRCIKHGRGTEWAKANPDICHLADKAAAFDTIAEHLGYGRAHCFICHEPEGCCAHFAPDQARHIAQALATPPAMRECTNDPCIASAPARGGVDDWVAGPVWQDENGDWSAEIQIVGGHGLVATFYGETREDAEANRAAALRPTAPGEVEGHIEAMLRFAETEGLWDDCHDEALEGWRRRRGEQGMDGWRWWWKLPDDDIYCTDHATREEAIEAARKEEPDAAEIDLIEARNWSDDFDVESARFADTRNYVRTLLSPNHPERAKEEGE